MNNKSGSERLKAWVHWKLLEKDLDEDDKQFALDIQDLQKLCEEQKAENERLKVYPTAHVYDEHNKKVRILQSQLATQTERVRVLEKALEKIADYPDEIASCAVAKQALNQESLGDGGKEPAWPA